MSDDLLTLDEQNLLLRLAREALELGVGGKPLHSLDINVYSRNLREDGASFVTLTKAGQLRGCIGVLEPYQPLVQDVREHAVAAALDDYRFPSVSPKELKDIKIEISRLTRPMQVDYQTWEDLLKIIRPGLDGVVFVDGFRKATFLPQVWEKLPEPTDFFAHLCQKMGLPANTWRLRKFEVKVYQVEDFQE